MNKRHLHHVLKQLRQVRAWYFVIAILVSLGVSMYAIRQNNIRTIELRDAVLQVDKDNGDVETALHDLREYVYGHMNSDLASPTGAYPPIQLKYRYERLAVAEKERVSAANAQLYTEAQAYCETAIPTGRSLNRIDCIQDYITSKGGATEKAIPDALYKFAFASPAWSPDLAGWSILVTAVLLIAFIARTSVVLWLKYTLRE